MTTPAAASSASPAALVRALRAFSEQADHAADQAGRRIGLHRTDLRALSVLMSRTAQGLPTTPTDLGRALHLTRASATAVVDRLVASGHARRTPSEQDGRRVLVEPTPSAAADGAAAFGPMGRRISDALAGFDPADLEVALRVIEAATQAVAPLAEEPR